MANAFLEAWYGEDEVLWSSRINRVHHLFRTNRRFMRMVRWAEVVDHLIYLWPHTLLGGRLPWGPEPHLGLQGGLSGWGLDLALDRLDHLVGEVARWAGPTEVTNVAWRLMALHGTINFRCPECGHVGGPQHQLAQYGIIDICDTCWGVDWGNRGALY